MSKRPVGRPPLDASDPSVRVGVSLPSKEFDALYARAVRSSTSMSAIIRRLLADSAKKKFLK